MRTKGSSLIWKPMVQGMVALLLLCSLSGNAMAAPEHNDVRVLIDISGSMQTNDPSNLRRPALRMLVGLMQPGTRAAVWTFAKWTNPLLPLADVDKPWKDKALAASEQIKSPGQFTDIERVLEEATADWSIQPGNYQRHLLLLTDGMVDVSKNAEESAASRQRVLEKVLPRIKELGGKIHTVALSERADHALMKQLSEQTGGWYQQVDSADNLQRVFLKIFEQVGKPDAVPLEGNRFTVDASVREATLLLFRQDGSPGPVLVSPDGEQFSDSDLPAGIAWYRDQGYDLITLASPRKGEWILQADTDPDNRVMIVTDLKLQTSEIPAHIAVGEQMTMSAHLSNRGQLVDRQAFLRLLEVRADALNEAGTDPQGLNDAGQEGDQKAGDGRYGMYYREQRAFDQVELLFSVDSPTFMREKRFRLAVHEPASLTIAGDEDALYASVDVAAAVVADGAQLVVWQTDPTGAKQMLDSTDGGNRYPLKFADRPAFASISGRTLLGNLIEREYGPVYPPGVSPAPAVEPEVATQPEPAPPAAPEVEEPVKEAEAEASEEDSGWLLPAALFGGVNLLLLIVGGGVWWWMRKRRGAEEDASLLDELDDLSMTSTSATGPGSVEQGEAA